MKRDTSDTLYSVSSWKTDDFMFSEHDRTYSCKWESKCKNAYDIIKKEYDMLVEEAKAYRGDMKHMNVVMKAEYHESTFPSCTFPDKTTTLFSY